MHLHTGFKKFNLKLWALKWISWNLFAPYHLWVSGQKIEFRNTVEDFCYQVPCLYFGQSSKEHCEDKHDF